jgi:hypothetical protein
MAGWWVDAAGAPPHGYVAVQCGARVASWWSPNRCFGCCECCEAPVEGGGHVPCGREMAAAGGFL